MEENLETHTIFKLDVLKGKSSIDIDGLADLLLEHFDHRLNDDPTTPLYEDSFCPDSPIIDSIVEELEDSCALVISDYDKGVVTTEESLNLIYKANNIGIPVCL